MLCFTFFFFLNSPGLFELFSTIAFLKVFIYQSNFKNAILLTSNIHLKILLLIFGLFVSLYTLILGKTLLSSHHNLSLLFRHQVTARAAATAWGSASAQEKSFQPCQVRDGCCKVVSEEEEKKEEKEDQTPPASNRHATTQIYYFYMSDWNLTVFNYQ